ncbi:hypothetical protein [Tepidimonas sp.]|uniref:hypothetical protein n=1 Tax=Tepidimonas sp. TaxID=2002775 RepID=UPI002FE3A61F
MHLLAALVALAGSAHGGQSGPPNPRRLQRERVAAWVRGVVSNRWRVRALSLDRAGVQHLVLMGEPPPTAGRAVGSTPQAARLQAKVPQEAAHALGLQVRALYWRGAQRPAAPQPAGDDAHALSAPRS